MVRLATAAGLKLVHVPYKGGGPAVVDVIGGHIDLVVGSAALGAPHVKAGKLHPVVQTGTTRLPALANTQTLAEAGYPGLESYAWWGVFAPKGTPQAAIDRFSVALRAVLQDEKVVAQLVEGQQMTLVATSHRAASCARLASGCGRLASDPLERPPHGALSPHERRQRTKTTPGAKRAYRQGHSS